MAHQARLLFNFQNRRMILRQKGTVFLQEDKMQIKLEIAAKEIGDHLTVSGTVKATEDLQHLQLGLSLSVWGMDMWKEKLKCQDVQSCVVRLNEISDDGLVHWSFNGASKDIVRFAKGHVLFFARLQDAPAPREYDEDIDRDAWTTDDLVVPLSIVNEYVPSADEIAQRVACYDQAWVRARRKECAEMKADPATKFLIYTTPEENAEYDIREDLRQALLSIKEEETPQ